MILLRRPGTTDAYTDGYISGNEHDTILDSHMPLVETHTTEHM